MVLMVHMVHIVPIALIIQVINVSGQSPKWGLLFFKLYSMKELSSVFYKKLSLVLLLFILANPIMLYMLTDNVIITMIIFLIDLFLLLIIINDGIKSKFLLNILIFVNILIFIIMSSELVFRNNFSFLKINQLYEKRDGYYFNKPHLNKILTDNEYETIYKTDNNGYRIGHLTKHSENIDWLFLGDSYTQGAQVNFEDLFTSKLNDKFQNINILNAGISGFNLINEYNYLIKEGIYLKPKKIFLSLCVLNDFNSFNENRYSFLDLLMEKSYLVRYAFYNYRFKTKENLPLKRWVEPFFENEQDNINSNILYTKTSEIKFINLSKFETYIKKIKEATSSIDAKLYVILVPTKEQVYPKFYNEVIENYNIDTNFVDLERSSEIMKKLSSSIGFTFIDPLNEFRIDSCNLYFEIDEHLNAAGHAKLSKIINQALINE